MSILKGEEIREGVLCGVDVIECIDNGFGSGFGIKLKATVSLRASIICLYIALLEHHFKLTESL